ncbi:CIA30 family protein [Flavobacteriaceae bacterium]|jgi:NADH dehydrogenase [ubiquinone] 1 alpha subcomplex assembly factor 1|nr:CIA30 family protein [Flavobacteriaceae bacterium]MDC0552025.1 CIA30 family protein [Flavobacteriaceae bacterium]
MTNYIYTILIISHLITMQTNKINILDNDRNNWLVVNDNVMGGVSESNIRFSKNNTLIFQGRVSIENNGGFASFRYKTKNLKVNKDQKIKMVVIGDSKEYQIRIKPSQNIRYTYSKTFKTTNSKQIIEIPLNEFTAQYRGYKLNMENFDFDKIEEFGILVGNKKNEEFRLEIIDIEFIN